MCGMVELWKKGFVVKISFEPGVEESLHDNRRAKFLRKIIPDAR